MKALSFKQLTDPKVGKFCVPDLNFVRDTIQPVDERCPHCKKHRNPHDMVYITVFEAPVAACWHCLPSFIALNGIDYPTTFLIRESEAYVRELANAINPLTWLLKPTEDHEEQRQWILSGATKAVQENWYGGECQGKYSIAATMSPDKFIEKQEKCFKSDYKAYNKYFSSLGVVCIKCLKSRPEGVDLAQHRLDLKQKQRCICEGWRYAAWLASWDNKLSVTRFDLEDSRAEPWRIKWPDWRPEEYVDTKQTDNWNFRWGVHTRRRKREFLFL